MLTESPDFRPGLFVKGAPGPEGRVSTSGRRPAKKKSHDAMFFVNQRPRTSVRGFLSDGFTDVHGRASTIRMSATFVPVGPVRMSPPAAAKSG